MKQQVMGWQWHQLAHMQIICTSFQTDNHANTLSLNFFYRQMLLLTPNQQCQSTGCYITLYWYCRVLFMLHAVLYTYCSLQVCVLKKSVV